MKRGLDLSLIRQKRKEKKLTLQEMAEKLGLKHASTYMKYEKGDYSFRADQLPLLVMAFDCKIQDLFFENCFAKTAKHHSQMPAS